MLRALRIVLAGLAVLALGTFVVLAVLRAGHPYELEWQEGGVLAHVERLAHGAPLYAAPSLDYIAFPYPPLYYAFAAGARAVLGPGFLAPRVVSIAASLVAFFLLHRIVARRTGSAFAGLCAAGLFAACYRFAGAWLDVARVDALSIALTLAGVEIVLARRGAFAAAAAGVLFALAFLAKQSALAPAALCLAGLALRSRRDALVAAGVLAVSIAATTLVFDARTDGWYRWFVFGELAGQGVDGALAFGFARETLVAFAPLLALVVVAAGKRELDSRGPAISRSERDPAAARDERIPVAARDERVLSEARDESSPSWTAPFVGALVGLVLAAGVGRAHAGGYDNTLLPACAAAALAFGVLLARLLALGGARATLAGGLGIAQLALFAYDPRMQVPTDADRRAGDAFVERLRATPGDAWVPDHGYLAERAGKGASAHGMAVIDLLRSDDHATAQRFVDELVRAIQARRWGAIVLDQRWDADLPALGAQYSAATIPWPSERAFVPVTGDPRRPGTWYAPRGAR